MKEDDAKMVPGKYGIVFGATRSVLRSAASYSKGTAILLIGFGTIMAIKFIVFPYAVNSYLALTQDEHRLGLEVGDWSLSFWPAQITASNVSLKAQGRFSQPYLFTADKVVADIRLSKLMSFSPDFAGSVKGMAVSDARVFVEKSLSDRWNWSSAMSTRKLERQIDNLRTSVQRADSTQVSRFDINHVHVDGLSIHWIEELPAKSGNGRIQTLRSELHIDDGELIFRDIAGWLQEYEQPIAMEFAGRTADGVIKATGEFNPFWVKDQLDDNLVKVGWSPKLENLRVYLENVDAKAFGNMVPDSLFKPTQGKMTGEVLFNLTAEGVSSYDLFLELDKAKWSVNENSSLYEASFKDKTDRQDAEAELTAFAKSGVIKASSKGQLSDPNFRLIPSIQTAVTRQALQDSPPVIQRTAALDQSRFEDKELSPVMAQLEQINQTAATVDQAAQTAASVANTLNTITGGLGQAGGAIGGLFKRR